MSARRFAAAFVTGAVLLACGGGEGPTEPVPGTLELRLTTPNANDRAILVTVTGPALAGVTSVGSGYVAHGRVAGSTATAAVFGPLASGALVRVSVADVGQLGAYTATIVEVADDANQLRTSLAGYSLTVVR